MNLIFVAAAILLVVNQVLSMEIIEMVIPPTTDRYFEVPFDSEAADDLSPPELKTFTMSNIARFRSMDLRPNFGYIFEVELVQMVVNNSTSFGSVVGMEHRLPLEASLIQRDQREYFGSLQCNSMLTDTISLRIIEREDPYPPYSRMFLDICSNSGIRGFVDMDNRPLQMPAKMENFQLVFTGGDDDIDIIFETHWILIPWPRMWYNFIPMFRYQEKYHLAFSALPLGRSRRRIRVMLLDEHEEEDEYEEYQVEQSSSADDYSIDDVNLYSIKPSDDICAICLDGFDEGASKLSTCSHLFHRACLNKWLDSKPRSTGACPTCKQG